MAGQKPDYRLMFPEDNGRGKKTWFKIGGGWKSEEKGTVGIEINVGLPIVLQPHTKLVLVPNEDDSFERQEQQ